MGLTDDVRKFVYKKYIQPAIGRGDKTITLRAGDIHEAMGLSHRMPAVCSALKTGMDSIGSVKVTDIKSPPSGLGANVYVTYAISADGIVEVSPPPAPIKGKSDVDALSEDEIKRVIFEHLKSQGWGVSVKWGTAQGKDIDAMKGAEHWIIEAKGPGSRQPMRVNYFIAILGEILQRMDDPTAKYSIALPDLSQFRRLWERLPPMAKKRIDITALFVDKNGRIEPEYRHTSVTMG